MFKKTHGRYFKDNIFAFQFFKLCFFHTILKGVRVIKSCEFLHRRVRACKWWPVHVKYLSWPQRPRSNNCCFSRVARHSTQVSNYRIVVMVTYPLLALCGFSRLRAYLITHYPCHIILKPSCLGHLKTTYRTCR